ncbi:DUF4112 domain-containing protein [Pontibacter qinzhouensis]|uniref:DUF4112 domain-containing protein n=1 Tax=Pontibacter qinzhouensis TaxID=2603253 RepID=A0A5C8IRB5_9BACT|nr:DUF4112 domain-containing protein [Pontibacter qinzhouensis]TXK23462.1 DUF4112 domain-containing protein [Pontibacter qinzhouensis]
MAELNIRYSRTPHSEKLKWVDRMTKVMDNQFRFPGTNWRFGLDPLLGLFPGVGDLASFVVSALLIMTMARHGASGKLVTLMLLNSAMDAIIGSIPLLGNIFDFAYKANERNVKMLRSHYEQGKYQGSGKGIVMGVLVAVLLITVVMIWLMWQIIAWSYRMLGEYL